MSVYSATKAALRSFARTWTTDLKARKIRINVVSPGPIDTPGLQGLNDATSEQLTAAFAGSVPLGRTGKPRRHREGRGLPRVRREQLHHRYRALRRRRHGAGLTAFCPQATKAPLSRGLRAWSRGRERDYFFAASAASFSR